MKKILVLLLVVISSNVFAQVSVLLRINYTPGDSYTQFIETSQNSGLQMAMKMSMSSDMKVIEVKDEITNTESQITSIAMDIMQGGMSMSYDSNANEETLDQMGKMLQSRFKPMMDAKIMSSTDKMGNVVDMSIEPEIPAMKDLAKNNGIAYPEEAIKVGSTWSATTEVGEVKTSIIYTVKEISKELVYLDVSGTISGVSEPSIGVSEGSISGFAEIDIESGAMTAMEMNTSVKVSNAVYKDTTKITMTKN
jgi:hypothetical protein